MSMEPMFREVSLRVEWRLRKSSLEDTTRDHERDFVAFAELVLAELKHRTMVRAYYEDGSFQHMKEIRFVANTSVDEEEWIDAIAKAAKLACVQTDRSMWSFVR